MSYLPYISDEDLKKAVKKVVKAARSKNTSELPKNVIDPFSATFEGVVYQMSYENWVKKEKMRQTQKSLQNAIGGFHQEILGSVPEWENLDTGKDKPKGVILCNKAKKIVAKIKNKYNTLKGSDRVVLYDELLSIIKKPDYYDFTAYYVEIVPSKQSNYNVPFVPSDNKTSTKRTENQKIRRISGQLFYDLATQKQGALRMLFEILPNVILEVLPDVKNEILPDVFLEKDVEGYSQFNESQKVGFKLLFDNAYQ